MTIEKQLRDAADARVLRFIENNAGATFSEVKASLGDILHWRKIDKSLQRLRKIGTVKYSRKCGWSVLTIMSENIE